MTSIHFGTPSQEPGANGCLGYLMLVPVFCSILPRHIFVGSYQTAGVTLNTIGAYYCYLSSISLLLWIFYNLRKNLTTQFRTNHYNTMQCVSRVELHISCRGLMDKDTMSKSDPCVVLFMQDQGSQWSEVSHFQPQIDGVGIAQRQRHLWILQNAILICLFRVLICNFGLLVSGIPGLATARIQFLSISARLFESLL